MCSFSTFIVGELTLICETLVKCFRFFEFYCILENCLKSICSKILESQYQYFFPSVFDLIIISLNVRQAESLKFSVLKFLRMIWHFKPLLNINDQIVQILLANLFDNRYSFRDLVFKTMIMIIQIQNINTKDFLDRVSQFQNSPLFSESDGAARLLFLSIVIKKETNFGMFFKETWNKFEIKLKKFHLIFI
jgi:hypothetical protein